MPTAVAGISTVNLKIRRFNPELDTEPHWETYEVDVQPGDRLLNLLMNLKGYFDGTLTFRRSCAHGICGSDAMRINGVNRLACKVLVKDLVRRDGDTIMVEPIKGLPVLKDLVVDMEPFFEAYRQVQPFLMTSGNEPTRERLQSPEDRARFDDTTKCILCAACTTSCPVYWNDGAYFGPAAIVNAHRFIFDSPRRGIRGAAGDPERRRGRVALPHHLQLLRGLPARHRGHQGHPRSKTSPPLPPRLTRRRPHPRAWAPAQPQPPRLGGGPPPRFGRHFLGYSRENVAQSEGWKGRKALYLVVRARCIARTAHCQVMARHRE